MALFSPLFVISLPSPLGKHRKRCLTQAQTLQTCPKRSEAFSCQTICLHHTFGGLRLNGVLVLFIVPSGTPHVFSHHWFQHHGISKYIKFNSFLIQHPETQGPSPKKPLGSEMPWPQVHRPWRRWSRTSVQLRETKTPKGHFETESHDYTTYIYILHKAEFKGLRHVNILTANRVCYVASTMRASRIQFVPSIQHVCKFKEG